MTKSRESTHRLLAADPGELSDFEIEQITRPEFEVPQVFEMMNRQIVVGLGLPPAVLKEIYPRP